MTAVCSTCDAAAIGRRITQARADHAAVSLPMPMRGVSDAAHAHDAARTSDSSCELIGPQTDSATERHAVEVVII